MSAPIADPAAWYRHFWPWFIVVLLGVSVVASLVTVSIAYRVVEEAPLDEVGRDAAPSGVRLAPGGTDRAGDPAER